MKIVSAIGSIGLLIVLHTLLLLDIGRRLILALDSDSLYLVSVYQDLFVDGFGITGWTFSPAPCFFPDLCLLAFFAPLTSSLGIGLVLYNLAYFFLLAFCLFEIIHFWKIPAFNSLSIIFSSLLVLAVLLHSPSGLPFASVFLGPGRHSGCLLIGLFLILIAFRWLERGMVYFEAILFFVLSFLTVFSDVSFIHQFLAPLCVVIMVYAWKGWTSWKIALRMLTLSVLAAIGGRLVLAILIKFQWLIVPKPNLSGLGNWRVTYTSACQFIADVGSFFDINPNFLFLALGGTVLSILFLIVFRKDFQKESFPTDFTKNPRFFLHVWFLFSLISVISTLSLPIVSGLWMSSAEIRYIQPVLIYPYITFIFLFTVYHRRIPRRISVGIFLILVSFGLISAVPGKRFQWNDFQFPYPEKAQFLDRITTQYNLRYGYSDYWNAKYLTLFSRNAIRVNQLAPTLMPYFWINNRHWYCKTRPEDKTTFPNYQFIITDRLQRKLIETRFGKPAHIERCTGMEIYIYNRSEDWAFRNFLRQFFMKEEDSKTIFRPLDPRPLQRYKPIGIPWNQRDNIIMSEGRELLVHFPPQTTGDILEISADRDDEYEITFFHQWMGSNLVPVPETLHVPAGKGDGLDIRYVKIPNKAAAEPFAALRIIPAKGDHRYSIGHLFIYTDPVSK